MTEQTLSGGQLSDGSRGFMMAMGAYGLWALLPFYLKALSHLPALEIVAHRVIWSVPVAAILLLAIGQFRTILEALRKPRMLAMAALTAALITVNWSVYVWAVAHDQIIGAALGYYINPLFNVVLGGLFSWRASDQGAIYCCRVCFFGGSCSHVQCRWLAMGVAGLAVDFRSLRLFP